MTEEYRGPYKDRVEDWMKRRRALADPSDLSPETRFAIALPRLESVVLSVIQEEANRDESQGIIDEARRYVPEFTREVLDLQKKPLALLARAGVDLANLDVLDVLKGLSETKFETRMKRDQTSRMAESYDETTKGRRRDVQTRLHPDKNDQAAQDVFEADFRTEVFGQITEATEESESSPDVVNINFLRVIPAHILASIKKELQDGKTIAQILKENPRFLEKAQESIYLSQAYLPFGQFDSTYLSPQDAEKEATRMKDKDDLYSYIYGANVALTVFVGLSLYVQIKEGEAQAKERFGSLANVLLEVGGYLGGIVDARERGRIRYESYDARYRMGKVEERLKDLAQRLGELTQAFVEVGSDSVDREQAISDTRDEAYAVLRSIKYYIEALVLPQPTYVPQPTSGLGSSYGYGGESGKIINSNFKNENNKNYY